MDCANVGASISIKSTTEDATTAQLGPEIVCSIVEPELVAPWFGSLPTMWTLKTSLINVSNGIHVVTIKDATSVDGLLSTNSTDNFFILVGKGDNPLVFPQSANYTRDLLHQSEDGKLFISHKAAGADQFRYSLNWGSTYSAWQPYTGGNTTLAPKKWSGTKAQEWKGEHVIVQYHSNTLGSSNHVQHGDLDAHQSPRRFPHLFLHGDFNRYGLDNGLDASLRVNNDGIWSYKLLAEWPVTVQVNEWGINPDGKRDEGGVYGDLDKDGVLDRLPPSSLIPATLGLNSTPPSPFLTWHLEVNDGTLGYSFKPAGNRWQQMIVFILMWAMPVLTGSLAVWGYLQSSVHPQAASHTRTNRATDSIKSSSTRSAYQCRNTRPSHSSARHFAVGRRLHQTTASLAQLLHCFATTLHSVLQQHRFHHKLCAVKFLSPQWNTILKIGPSRSRSVVWE